MRDTRYEKYAADKIALLGLFTVALLTARFITASRSAIVLSKPIKLSYTGLSVSMPAGNGWQSEKQWKYQENSFTLSSIFGPGSGSVTTLAHCRYLLAATKAIPDTQFKQKASEVGASVAKTGQIQTGTPGPRFAKRPQNGAPLTIDWAHIKKQKTLSEMFFGTARLPNNRQLDIEVHQATGDTDLAEQVFKRIAESLEFKDNQLLKAGGEIVTKIKNEGLDSFFQDQSRQTFFLIKDVRKRTIGFTMDVLINATGPDAQSGTLFRSAPFNNSQNRNLLNIQSAGFYYIRGRYASEQVILFQSNNRFDEFIWKSETSNQAGRSGTELILDKAGVMTVRKLKPQAKEKKYQLSSAAIPEVFLEFTFSRMLDSDHKKIVVDTIEADGTITPRFISRIEAEDYAPPSATSRSEEKAAYVLRVEFLGRRGFSEQVYLNSQKQISRILMGTPTTIKGVWRPLRHENAYVLERTSAENILREFPEQADYILQKNKMLKQDQPQY